MRLIIWLFLGVLLLLSACGPDRERANRMRQQMAMAEQAYLEGLRNLDAYDFAAAASAWDNLHLVSRSPDKDAVELLVDGRTALLTAELLKHHFHQGIEDRLPRWRQAYLESRLDLPTLDTFLDHQGWQTWPDLRQAWQQDAAAKAKQELRLRIQGDPLLPEVRTALTNALLKKAAGRVNTGYDLAEPPPGQGELVATVMAEWVTWKTPEGTVLGQAPSKYSIRLAWQTDLSVTWPEVQFLTPRAKGHLQPPEDTVYADRSAGYTAVQAYRNSIAELMSDQVTLWLSEWPELKIGGDPTPR